MLTATKSRLNIEIDFLLWQTLTEIQPLSVQGSAKTDMVLAARLVIISLGEFTELMCRKLSNGWLLPNSYRDKAGKSDLVC